jgi:hypothetical protein
LHGLGFQDAGLSIRLVKASDLAPNACGMSNYDIKGLFGEIDVLRSDEYVNLPGCLDGVDIPKDQLNTVIHEVMHMVLAIPSPRKPKWWPSRESSSRAHGGANTKHWPNWFGILYGHEVPSLS